MKRKIFYAFVVLGFLCWGLAIATSRLYAQPATAIGVAPLSPALNAAASRACLFPTGGWTIVNCSNVAAASSGALNAWSRYVIQCGDDSYLAVSTSAAAGLADANDGWLPMGAWLEFLTTDTIRYVSCLNINADSDCRYWECR